MFKSEACSHSISSKTKPLLKMLQFVAVAFLFVASVAGQSECILSCAEAALPVSNCTSIEDLPCMCASAPYQQDALLCIQQTCPMEELAEGVKLIKERCADIEGDDGGLA
ncbi:ectomycorrhiza-regulated cfem domain-containing protein [Moniliophthora roreri]|nr:ectomycorrhiza-regulated cfem domain-containing protein [Moniliophthora roreri]